MKRHFIACIFYFHHDYFLKLLFFIFEFQAGADMFVAGSAILKNPRTQDAYAATIKSMRDSLATVKR